MMHLPGKPELNGFSDLLFSRKPPVYVEVLGKPPKVRDAKSFWISTSVCGWDPRMFPPGQTNGVEGASFLGHMFIIDHENPHGGRGLYPKQCHLKPYNRLLLRAYEAIDCPLIDKWPAALGGVMTLKFP